MRSRVQRTRSSSQKSMLTARAVLDLADALDSAVEEHGGTRLLSEVELPLIGTLVRMEQVGIAVDSDEDAAPAKAKTGACTRACTRFHLLARLTDALSPSSQAQEVPACIGRRVRHGRRRR